MFEVLQHTKTYYQPTQPLLPIAGGLLSSHPSQRQTACLGVATSLVLLDVVHCGLGSNKEGWGLWSWQLSGKPSVG